LTSKLQFLVSASKYTYFDDIVLDGDWVNNLCHQTQRKTKTGVCQHHYLFGISSGGSSFISKKFMNKCISFILKSYLLSRMHALCKYACVFRSTCI
jgi:hypothetical protein